MHHCALNDFDLSAIVENLAGSRRFAAVGNAAQEDSPYQLLLSVSRKYEVDAALLGDTALTLFSFGMIASHYEFLMDVEAVVTWRNIPIAIYQYQIPWDRRRSIMDAGENPDNGFAALLREQLFNDFDKSAVFEEETLYSVLNASDYVGELNHPPELGEYVLEERLLRPDPLLGLQLRYQHREFEFDKIDVFVYPVRYTEWENSAALIDEELLNIQSELLGLKEEGIYSELDFSGIEELNAGTKKGQLLRSFLTDAAGVSYRIQTAVFIKQDKFVTLRASNPVAEVMPDIEGFWLPALQAINPPAESNYMAQLRRKARAEMSQK
jgi:hypothetical protein